MWGGITMGWPGPITLEDAFWNTIGSVGDVAVLLLGVFGVVAPDGEDAIGPGQGGRGQHADLRPDLVQDFAARAVLAAPPM